jgi:hypothetical protein
MECPPTIELIELTPLTFGEYQEFVEEGLSTVVRKVRPDWGVPNIVSAVYAGNTNCVLVRRNGKNIGFVVYYKQPRPFSLKPDLFIWAAYAIPLKHRSRADNVPEVVDVVWRYLAENAKTKFGTNVIRWMTSARRAKSFAKKYGWKPDFVSFGVSV